MCELYEMVCKLLMFLLVVHLAMSSVLKYRAGIRSINMNMETGETIIERENRTKMR